jgi:hypothetical protein
MYCTDNLVPFMIGFSVMTFGFEEVFLYPSSRHVIMFNYIFKLYDIYDIQNTKPTKIN